MNMLHKNLDMYLNTFRLDPTEIQIVNIQNFAMSTVK